MCVGYSAVYSARSMELYTSNKSMAHTNIKKEHGIRDTAIDIEMLVDLELHPVGCLTDPEGVKDWELVVDNYGVEPDWWNEHKDYAEREIRLAARLWCEHLTNWDGGLHLSDTNIKSLGSLESVGGWLYLSDSDIKSLGALKSVGGDLDLSGTKIDSLGVLESVGGGLYLGSSRVTSLGVLESVGGELDLRYTGVTSLGSLESVGGGLYLSGTNIKDLGSVSVLGKICR